ncbi:unnamed protein product, partial [Brassica rapa subsp. trilocularis]
MDEDVLAPEILTSIISRLYDSTTMDGPMFVPRSGD